MVHLVNLLLFWHPAVFAVERHCNFGFQIPLPLVLPLLHRCHNASRVSKLKRYSNLWDVVIDTAYGTKAYSLGGCTASIRTDSAKYGPFWNTNLAFY
jgi:hypothetical protein